MQLPSVVAMSGRVTAWMNFLTKLRDFKSVFLKPLPTKACIR